LIAYPFENLNSEIKFELLDFKLRRQRYSFDFYRINHDDELIIGRNVNGIPSIKFNGNQTQIVVETFTGPYMQFQNNRT